ncbi:tail sheath stabilizer [Klebsiella phage Menlow]|uniref:Tail sheath stabilizing and tail completion protein n=1 Tax=Klebsiella phage Menlow TaxID=2054273 RepID=A0A2H5BN55_9CAUD|nr:tail sheath stabilizer [Klebsiella phage Menlow]AUG87760.1 tail sheath stabilizing and tail completion protein [Klebsiella phage Menlow]UJD04944.1 tail sheath stabilizer and completion protein [Klebsiella phage PWKp5]
MRPFQNYFYHGSLLKYIHVFNAIMSDVQVKTERGLMKVPLHMAIGRRNDLNRNTPANALPFATMSFGQFEINKQVTNSYHNKLATNTATSKQRIPIIIDFEYNVRTKKMNEMLQILEQIYSVYTPSIDCQIKDNETLKQDQVVKIQLVSHTMSDNWEGDAAESPHVDCNFMFQLHGAIYGWDYWVDDGSGTGDPNVIKEIIIEMSTDLNTPWTELPLWFTVDKDGVHHPEDD